MCNILAVPDSIRELSISDKEGRYPSIMQHPSQCIDLWVHDGFTHKRESTVLHLHALCHPLWLYSRNTYVRDCKLHTHEHSL